jgi:signal transduction histidine kinase/ligand-binding sensor domain-containing protein/CheY-like chemotaxis protein
MKFNFQYFTLGLIGIMLPLLISARVFINISEENGLSERWVRCIYQDKYGFMWFGTKDGLNRYDGYEFQIYKPADDENGLASGTINYFYEEQDKFWICTSKGLSQYNYETEEFTLFPYFQNTEIFCLLKSYSGVYWIGTQNGLYMFDPSNNSCRTFQHAPDNPSSLSHNQVLCVLEDSRRNLWVGTLAGLNVLNRKDSTFLHIHDKKARFHYTNVNVRDIYEDIDGRIWLGIYNGGVDILADINNLSNVSIHRVLEGICVRIFFARNNKLWVAWGNKNGVQSYNLKYFDSENFIFKPLGIEEGWLGGYSVESIFEDKWDDFWFGSYDKGLFYLSMRNKEFYTVNKNNTKPVLLSSDIVNVFHEDEHYLWVGTELGLDRYNKKTGKTRHFIYNQNDPGSIGSSSIFVLTKDSHGNFWVGTWGGGLNLYNSKSESFVRYPDILNLTDDKISKNVFSVFEDNRGNLWIGTIREGLFIFDQENNKFIDFTPKLLSSGTPSNASINQIFQTSDGKLWVSNYSALNLYNYTDSSFTFYVHDPDDSNSITPGDIEVLFEDSKNHLWIGTEGGLNCFDQSKNRFVHYTNTDGLSSSFIVGILEDDKGNIWVSTNNGISKFIQGIFIPQKPVFINFDQTDGLPSKEYVKRSTHKDAEGKLYFGGTNGFVYFQPDSITVNPVPPPVILTHFFINDTLVKQVGSNPLLTKAIYLMKEIRLSNKHRYFSIQYAALNYLNPQKNTFAYKLEGFEDHWHYVGIQRKATYTNISPGHYIFRVKAANNDGIWNEEGTSIKIFIRPPWWQTLFSRIVFISIVIAGIYAIFQLRIHNIKYQKTLLENMVSERTTELMEVNSVLKEAKEEVTIRNEELLNHHQNLEKLVLERTEKLREAFQKAEESDRLKSSFLANMSHEIRTPMNAIVGFASLLDGEELDEMTRKNYIRIINSNCETLLVIINDILEISLIEADQIKIENKRFVIDTVLTELETSFRLKKKDSVEITFVNRNENRSISLDNDPVRYSQCISNLISNALKYTKKGFVKFGYNLKKGEIVTYVSDSGIGIEKKEIEKIFQNFYKVENDDSQYYTGTGLGLAITNRLTELMGGRIWLESNPGLGTTFYISLPYSGDVAAKKKTVNKQEDGDIDLSNFTFLVAEDDLTNSILIQEILKSTQAEIEIVVNGIEAIQYLRENKNPDNLIVLMDIKMPEMDGYTTLKEIQKMNIKVPVIAITAYAQARDKKNVLNAGFTHYLSKPIRPKELMAVISKVIKKTAS